MFLPEQLLLCRITGSTEVKEKLLFHSNRALSRGLAPHFLPTNFSPPSSVTRRKRPRFISTHVENSPFPEGVMYVNLPRCLNGSTVFGCLRVTTLDPGFLLIRVVIATLLNALLYLLFFNEAGPRNEPLRLSRHVKVHDCFFFFFELHCLPLCGISVTTLE